MPAGLTPRPSLQNAVSLVLRLSWKSGSDSHETFVSWCGGISSEAQCIDIPQEFAACLGMGEGLKVRATGPSCATFRHWVDSCVCPLCCLKVKANIPKKKIKRAKTVNVSPLTADDWEVLELHPEELERQILNQINIVTQDMVVPIWTSNGAIIRVRIDEIQPEPSKKTPAARLDNTSEVIVAPRVRHKPAEQETEPADTKVWPTRLLRVLPNGCEMEGEDRGGVGGGGGSDPAQLTAVVSRTTMEKNGWSAGMLCSIGRASGAKDEGGCGARTHKSLEEKQDTAAAAKEASVDTGGVGGGTPPAGANAGQVYGEAPAERPTATGIFLYLAEQTSAGGLEPSAGPEAAADLGLEDHVVLSVEARRQVRSFEHPKQQGPSLTTGPGCSRLPLSSSSRAIPAMRAPLGAALCGPSPCAMPCDCAHSTALPAALITAPRAASLLVQLGAGLLTRVKVRPVQQGLAPPPLPTQPLLIQPVCWAGGGTGPGQPPPAEVPPAAAVLEAFAAFRARFAAAGPTAAGGALGQMMPVLQGSLLKLDLAGRALHVLLRFDAQQTFLCEPVPESEDGPASDVPPPAATAATTVKDIRWVDAATCPDRAKVTVGQAVELRRRPEPGFFGGPGLAEMVGVDSAKAAVVGYVLTQLAGAAARHSLGLPPGGGIIVHGQSGTGKSALAAAVGSAFRHGQGGHGVPAFTMTVDCGSFVGAKAAGLKLAWRELLDQAYRNAPTVIICDDLDQLVPEAGQDGQQAAARETVALGRFLADLLFPSNLSCLRPPGAAVAVIATCKDKGALSQRLRAIGRLDKEVGLSLPDAAGRAGQLRSLLAQLGVAADDRHLDLGALAARTDSFAAADLKRLAKRMAHHAAARYINAQPPATPRDGGGGGGPEPEPDEGRRLYHIADSKVAVTEADVELAMADGLAPAALQGVKLSAIGESAKGWAEVGGMAEVRATLREMFELPAKYPELFGTSPIRLRSGVLLYGPSGCGKTMMAAVIAKECGMHFISVKGPELLNSQSGPPPPPPLVLAAAASCACRRHRRHRRRRRFLRGCVCCVCCRLLRCCAADGPLMPVWRWADRVHRGVGAVGPAEVLRGQSRPALHPLLRRIRLHRPAPRQGQLRRDRPGGQRLPDRAGRRRGAHRCPRPPRALHGLPLKHDGPDHLGLWSIRCLRPRRDLPAGPDRPGAAPTGPVGHHGALRLPEPTRPPRGPTPSAPPPARPQAVQRLFPS